MHYGNGVSRRRMLYTTMIRYRTFPVHSHSIFTNSCRQGQFSEAYLQYRALSVEIKGSRKKATNHCVQDMQCSRHCWVKTPLGGYIYHFPCPYTFSPRFLQAITLVLCFCSVLRGHPPIRSQDATVVRRCKSKVRAHSDTIS